MFRGLLGISSIILWGLRLWLDANGAAKDALFLGVLLLTGPGLAVPNLTPVRNHKLTLSVSVGFAILLYTIFHRWKTSYLDNSGALVSDGNSRDHLKTSMKPLFFPCRTNHTRLFPKTHSFSYSYLLVGLPVGWQGQIGSLLSADLQSSSGEGIGAGHYNKRGKSWFSVDAADYLSRGESHLGIKEKLHAYLRTQGSNPEDYPYAYLITAPRFLGYAFNPVSFWFLYSTNKELKAMILEVNNTFDERRVYFLPAFNLGEVPTDHALTDHEQGSTDALENEAIRKPRSSIVATKSLGKFSRSWTKDFHVSPFNSCKGSYSLTAYDPLFPYMGGLRPIHNTITLNSTKAHAKLVARIFSTGSAIDPAQLDTWTALRFIYSWWWVGFMTFPRILKEAGKLFSLKRLHIWYRPEVLKDSIPRHESAIERTFELYFRLFLQDQVRQCKHKLGVKYVAAMSDCRREELFFPARDILNGAFDQADTVLELRVLTPAFYSRFAQYENLSEALNSEMFCVQEQRTIWISRPELLPQIFPRPKDGFKDTITKLEVRWLDRWRWSALQRLRRTLKPRSHIQSDGAIGTKLGTQSVENIRSLQLSPMDTFVLSHCTQQDIRSYRRAVTKLLVSQRLPLGFIGLLDLCDIVIRLVLAWVTVQALQALFIPFSEASSPSRPYSLYLLLATDLYLGFLTYNSSHVWAFGKSLL